MNRWQRFKSSLGEALFWMAFGLCCLLLVPVCLLLMAVSGLFTAAERCTQRLSGRDSRYP